MLHLFLKENSKNYSYHTIYNLFYGITIMYLKSKNLINFGQNITFYNFFILPWVHGQQFSLNCASWYVPQLFLVEITYILIKKFLRKIPNVNFIISIPIFILALLSTYEMHYNYNLNLTFMIPYRLFFLIFSTIWALFIPNI